MEQLKSMFSELFKFEINEEVRHRGDTKSYSADMGLLVLKRLVIESEDDDSNKVYERLYHCRMIRYSGSGDIAQFTEKELMTMNEYEDKKMKDDFERNQRHEDIKKTEREVMELFGISKEDYVFLIKNGEPDKTKKFRMSGFQVSEKGVGLFMQESLFSIKKENVKRENVEVFSKEDFVKIP